MAGIAVLPGRGKKLEKEARGTGPSRREQQKVMKRAPTYGS